MFPTARVPRGSALRSLTAAMALVLLAVAAPFGPARTDAATPVEAGYRDFLYGDPTAPGGDDVTAGRVQSKLWHHDGKWWGVLFDNRTTPNAKFRIWKFNMATQDWTNTTVAVDDRNRSHGDALSVSDTLWVASARAEDLSGTDQSRGLRVYRYAYNTSTDTYAPSTGFPKTIPGTATGTGYSTIARDSAGTLWVAFTKGNRVKISSSTDNGVNWSVPIDLPNMGNDVTSDDIAAIASMNGGVGVLWSNQAATDDAFYFVAHHAAGWGARETAFGTASDYDADGHISLKTDVDGNLVAAIKTGRNEDPAPNGGDPLVSVLRRTGAASAVGAWESHTVTTVTVEGTRPVLVLDDEADQANVFMTYPTLDDDGDQAIYRRTAPLSTLNFGTASVGTPFIDSATEVTINDATSMKNMTTAATGLIVEAVDIDTMTYLHGCAGDVCPDRPVANFTATPTSGNAPLTVGFTDTSTNTPTTWSWTFGDGGTSTAKNPSHTYSDAGTYTVSLTAANPAGSDVETKTGYITVDPPVGFEFHPIDPVRVLDSRKGVGLTGPFQANVPRTFDVPGIPDGAVAVTGNLTVVDQTAAGYVALGPQATAAPTFSTLNFPLGDIRGNGVTVKLAADDTLSAVYKAGAGKTTHLVLDITGYFINDAAEATFATPDDPFRVLDSRSGVGLSGPFVANTPRTFDVAGVGGAAGIPADAVAVTANLTVVGQTQAGYVAIGPIATSTPQFSTLNFPLGDIRGNGVTLPLAADGTLSAVYKAGTGRTTHLVLDVTGYFVDGAGGASFVPVGPERLVDSRFADNLPSALVHGTPGTFNATGQDGVASDAVAIVGNATVVGQKKAGYVAITPEPDATPSSSSLNFPLGDIRGNAFTVEIGPAGDVSAVYIAVSGATTHLVVDVTGYYR